METAELPTWLPWLGLPAALLLLWLISRALRQDRGHLEEVEERFGGAASAPAGATSPPSRARPSDSLHADLLELLRAGQKIEAIKRYRELTGLGLAEAKAAVEALERGAPLAPASSVSGSSEPAGASAPVARGEPTPEEWAALTDLVRARHKIEAIKRYREITGLGLKESKQAIDDLAAHLGC